MTDRVGGSGRGRATSSFWAQGRGMTLGGRLSMPCEPPDGRQAGGASSSRAVAAAESSQHEAEFDMGDQEDSAGVLYLVLQMLRSTKCQESARLLEQEAEKNGLFGETCDWTGKKRARTAGDFAKLAPHVNGSHLMRLIKSQSGQGSQQGALPLLFRKLGSRASTISSILTSITARDPTKRAINEVGLQRASEMGLRLPSSSTWRPYLYHRIDGRRSIMGHFCPVYCLIFDRTGLQIITGSDDKLVKIWNTRTQRLYRTLRGHVSDIVDLAVSGDNRFLASAGNDQDIRIWWLHNGVPALVLTGHEKQINRIIFCATLNADLSHSLVSVSMDGTTRVWHISSEGESMGNRIYSTSDQNQGGHVGFRPQRDVTSVNACALSSNGLWIATGDGDGHIRIYSVSGRLKVPVKFLGHNKAIDHLQFSPSGDKLASGACDGTARLWHLDNQLRLERQTVLNLRQGESAPPVSRGGSTSTALVPGVKMIAWMVDGCKVVTSQGLEKKDKSGSYQVRIKVWLADSGLLLHSFTDHQQYVFVLSPHPKDSRIFMSSGYDGQVILWDVETGTKVRSFQINFPSDDRLHPHDFDEKSRDVLDGHFHPDGMSFSVSHKNGFITIFSANTPLRVPSEQFFQTDFGDLVMDQQRNVIDRQAQLPPHQMPPGMMTDRFQHPYDEQNMYQRENFVPVLVAPPVARQSGQFEEDDVVAISDEDNDGDFRVASSDSSEASEEEMVLSDDDDIGGEDDDDDDEFTLEGKRSRIRRKYRDTQRNQRSERVQRRRQRIVESSDDEVDDGNESEVSDSDLLTPKRIDVAKVKGKSKQTHSVSALKMNAKRSREWLQGDKPPQHIDDDFIPQVGDTIVYFHQGHLACLEGGFSDESSIFPLTDFPSMKPAELCRVLNVNYQFPAPNEDEEHSIFCVLLLQLLPEGRHDEDLRHDGTFKVGDRVKARWKGKYRFPGVVVTCNGDNTYAVKFDDGDFERKQPASQMEYQTFSVSYRKTHLAEFVIPLYRYERNLGIAPWTSGDRFSMWFAGSDSQTYQGTVRAVRALDSRYPHSDWQRLMVVWDDAEGDDEYDGLERLSRWEIMTEGDDIAPPPIFSTLPETERDRIVQGLKAIMKSPTAEPFVLSVDTRVYADYLSYVALPMSLSQVLKRLEQSYYRSPEALQNDFELINRNARVFNKPGSPVFELAKKLSPILTRLVKNDDWKAALKQSCGQNAPSPSCKSKARNPQENVELEVAQDAMLQTWDSRASKMLQKFHKFNGSFVAQLVRVPSQLNSSISSEIREFVRSDMYHGIIYSSLRESLEGGLYKTWGHFAFEFLQMCCCGVLVNSRGGSKVYKQAIKIICDALSLLHSLQERAKQMKSPSKIGDTSGNMEVDGSSSGRSLKTADDSGVVETSQHDQGMSDGSKAKELSGQKIESLQDQISNVISSLAKLDMDGIFQMPVPLDKYPDYSKFVLSPMDFTTMADKNLNLVYTCMDEVGFDFLLICANAIIYNHHSMHVHQKAVQLLVGGLQVLHGKIELVASCEKVVVRDATDHGKAAIRHQVPASIESRTRSENVRGESSKSVLDSDKQAKDSRSQHPIIYTKEQITENRAFITKILASLRACDKMGLFWDPVTPEIAEDYHDIIPLPMDISSMEGRLSAGIYDLHPLVFLRDMLLTTTNALVYNSLGDEISLKAIEMAKKGLSSCADRLIEWNTEVASWVQNSRLPGAGYAIRGVPSLPQKLQQIESLDVNCFFAEPVLGIPEYGAFVKVPMDIQTMRHKLEAGMYTSEESFQADAFLIVVDCCIFNKADTPWHKAAVSIAREMLGLFFPKVSQEAATALGGGSSISKSAPLSGRSSRKKILETSKSTSHLETGRGSSTKRSRITAALESEDEDAPVEAPGRSRKRSKRGDEDSDENDSDLDSEIEDDSTSKNRRGSKRGSRGGSRRKSIDDGSEDEEEYAPKSRSSRTRRSNSERDNSSSRKRKVVSRGEGVKHFGAVRRDEDDDEEGEWESSSESQGGRDEEDDEESEGGRDWEDEDSEIGDKRASSQGKRQSTRSSRR